MRQSMEVLISHVFSHVKVDLGSRSRCQVLFTPENLGIISMGPCTWYSFVATVAAADCGLDGLRPPGLHRGEVRVVQCSVARG